MTVSIRDAVEADLEGIAKLHVQAWRESYKDFLSPEVLASLSTEERLQMWRGAFAQSDPRAKLLVAVLNSGDIVGFVRGGPIRRKGSNPQAVDLATETEIFAIYLLDHVKRQGIGRRLMVGVFDHLSAQGFGSTGLWVLKENAPARCFYEALGGKPGPEQTFDLRGQMVTEVAYRFEPIPRLA